MEGQWCLLGGVLWERVLISKTFRALVWYENMSTLTRIVSSLNFPASCVGMVIRSLDSSKIVVPTYKRKNLKEFSPNKIAPNKQLELPRDIWDSKFLNPPFISLQGTISYVVLHAPNLSRWVPHAASTTLHWCIEVRDMDSSLRFSATKSSRSRRIWRTGHVVLHVAKRRTTKMTKGFFWRKMDEICAGFWFLFMDVICI